MFVYESVPEQLQSISRLDEDVESRWKAAGIHRLPYNENDTDYEVYVDGSAVGSMRTNMSSKLSVSVELEEGYRFRLRSCKEHKT